jgi:hypothetical protein
LAQQLGLMSGLMLSLGWLLSQIARRRTTFAAPVGISEPIEVAPVRRGHEIVTRLKQQVAGSWRVGRASD